MAALAVGAALNGGTGGDFCLDRGSIMGTLDQFSLEGSPKALHGRIMVTAGNATETGQPAGLGEQGLVLLAGVLVGVRQKVIRWTGLKDRAFERFLVQDRDR